ncbi:hypothetical protein [Microbacterium sp. SORGH_AS_0421]|uniref:hypothetical protein n=1 Tax=Microbacterium sp. SORGH_AS_0421 TaxID=3041768 RepID=UPI00278F9428|nr:hypothetical protein [Microbacterium sp. SORGH_AS_0421]MDQ1176203.1 hypothetical protein [Microbacterium sp. SORGH_AS_0421]
MAGRAVAAVGGDAGGDGIRSVVEGVPAAPVHVQVDQAGGQGRPAQVDALGGIRSGPRAHLDDQAVTHPHPGVGQVAPGVDHPSAGEQHVGGHVVAISRWSQAKR